MMDQAERLRMLVRDRLQHKRPGGCRIVAVTSGKGGVGKTTVAVNLAVLLGRSGKRTAIMDADLGLSNVDVMLGMIPKWHLGHVLDGSKILDDVCETGPYGLQMISGGSGVEKLANLTESERSYLIEHLREFSQGFDYLIVDTSPGIGRSVMDFLACAGKVMVVTTPDPASLTDCYAAVKTIHNASPDVTVSLLVNRVDGPRRAEQAAGSINSVAGRFLKRAQMEWDYLPDDSAVWTAGNRQEVLVEKYPASPASVALRRVAVQVEHIDHSDANRRGIKCTA